jgi:hypothetical protein
MLALAASCTHVSSMLRYLLHRFSRAANGGIVHYSILTFLKQRSNAKIAESVHIAMASISSIHT